MGFDDATIVNANPGASTIVSRDAGKKKRTNRSAKLKQCKLDARREQWLSQVKGKDDCKPLSAATSPTSPLPGHPPRPRAGDVCSKRRGGREEERDDAALHENSDLNSPTHNLTSGNRREKNSPSNGISSESSTDSCSRSVSDADEEAEAGGREEDNGVLDDWEAVADALTEDDPPCDNNCNPNIVVHVERAIESAAHTGVPSAPLHGGGSTNPHLIQSTPRAWRPDDASRPRSLPSISKQWSFPASMKRHHGPSQRKVMDSLPTSCPICYEDLDSTDSSFLPCSCGFRLCLFCHKRILEGDARCPGCRKQYDSIFGGVMGVTTDVVQVPPLRFPRTCSMSSRF